MRKRRRSRKACEKREDKTREWKSKRGERRRGSPGKHGLKGDAAEVYRRRRQGRQRTLPEVHFGLVLSAR